MDAGLLEVSGVRLPSAWNFGAVERAIRTCAERPGEKIFFPSVGKIFTSYEEAYEFYNMYSWECGFGVRYGRSRENKSGKRTKQDIVCACEGRDSAEVTKSVRTGCPAMIRLLRQEGDGCYVSRFIDEHNHPMSSSNDERRQWNSHNRIDRQTKDIVRQLRSNNVSVTRVCSIVGGIHNSGEYIPFRRQSIRTLCARLAQESIEGDMDKTIKLFGDMKAKDPGLSLCVDLDSERRVRSLLWCHGTSRRSYAQFGEVVTFDTTYRTNLYNLPFGLFVGVNNHFQSVIFGAVLLTEETTEAFQWSFRSFVECMGKAPDTILTDQCQAMRAAISTELPNTRHRWCKWHVLRRAKESLGPLYTKNNAFKMELHQLIDEVVCPDEFESRWEELIRQYNLESNSFLRRAYFNRAMWAKPYFTETFCAGMTSTQRSESANHLLKCYISRSSPMHMFVSQYNRMIADRTAEAAREEHATKQVARQLRIGVPIEKDAAKLYTRVMYERFSRELFKSGAFTCVDSEEEGVYRVVLLTGRSDGGKAEFKVASSRNGCSYQCECKMFEHCGMPCRHILRLLVQTGVDQIPAGLLLKRWTREASDDDMGPNNSGQGLFGEMSSETMHTVLHAAAMELIAMCSMSRQGFELGIEYIAMAKKALREMTVVHGQNSARGSAGDGVLVEEVAIEDTEHGTPVREGILDGAQAPPRVLSRGRPKEVRMKSPVELRPRRCNMKKRETGGNVSGTSTVQGGGALTRSRGKKAEPKCRVCSSTEHLASSCPDNVVADRTIQPRKCHRCGEEGHYRNTCGRKSTYSVAKMNA